MSDHHTLNQETITISLIALLVGSIPILIIGNQIALHGPAITFWSALFSLITGSVAILILATEAMNGRWHRNFCTLASHVGFTGIVMLFFIPIIFSIDAKNAHPFGYAAATFVFLAFGAHAGLHCILYIHHHWRCR